MKKERERDLTKIDPNATPIQMEQRLMAHMKHPDARNGILTYDKMTLELNISIPGQGPPVTNDRPLLVHKRKYVGDPETVELIPAKFLNRDQPKVGTCSKPIPGRNLGCFSHGGCPYTDDEDLRGRGPGPFNVMMVGPDGIHHPCPCYNFYHSARRGFPTSQVHYAFNGYKVDVDVISESVSRGRFVKDEFGNQSLEDVVVEQVVDNLGPMYAHHFGKRKQKAKAEKQLQYRQVDAPDLDEVDDETFNEVPASNQIPGKLNDAPKMSPTPSVKI